MDKMILYNHLPIWGQNFACSVEGWRISKTRYGSEFWKYLSAYESRSSWTYEYLVEFRDKRLRKMVKHCYETVPYYKQIFDEGGIDPVKIKTLDDLGKLPILTKSIINAQPEKFLSTIYPQNQMIVQHTSGTTGTGLVFQSTKKAICEQWAVWWRYRRRLGIKMDIWCALFGGRSIVSVSQRKPPYYRINKPGKQVYFSAYHMSHESMCYYVEALEKYHLQWIHGYPSSISLLAQYMLENRIRLSYKVKWITTGAENLLQYQKDMIQKAFGVEPYQHYGMSEGVANISENADHQYIIDEDYACVEFIKDDPADTYRIIGTNLTNFAMPFLRYEVGDCAQLAEGDRRRILSIDGRKEDYLVLSNHIKIGRLDHIFKDMTTIKEAQIQQDEEGRITFFVVKGKAYDIKSEQKLKREIEERLGKEPYQIKYTDQIQKTKSGKIRFVVSGRRCDNAAGK